jgi:hypothetical protein
MGLTSDYERLPSRDVARARENPPYLPLFTPFEKERPGEICVCDAVSYWRMPRNFVAPAKLRGYSQLYVLLTIALAKRSLGAKLSGVLKQKLNIAGSVLVAEAGRTWLPRCSEKNSRIESDA